MTVQITRLEHDADALRPHAARVSVAAVARRLLALALVLEGHSRVEAAKSCGMDRQTLRDWVIRYNEHGIAGLSDLPKRGGATPKLSVGEKAVLTEWVQQGPDLAEDGVVRWRLRDLRDRILARFFVVMDERSVGRILKTLTFSHISVRPRHPQANGEAQVFRDSSDGRSYCLTRKCSRASRALPHLNAPEPRSLCQPTFDRRGWLAPRRRDDIRCGRHV
jgi:transposase